MPQVGVYSAPYELPAARDQQADAYWVTTYFHKTQSFMKNGGQQKCLDKALVVYLLQRSLSQRAYTQCHLYFCVDSAMDPIMVSV